MRIHGTPRVTVLVGADHARSMWRQWLEASGLSGALYEGSLDEIAPQAAASAIAAPVAPVALLAAPAVLAAWRRGRGDRLAAMLDEGIVEIAEPAARAARAAAAGARTALFDARSAAEVALFEALEATPATAGRFELNGYLSVCFGASAAEVDLLSRRDGIAIEIDGYHHFQDLDAYRRDRKKDLLLQLQGLIVIRLAAQDVMRDPRLGLAAVSQALAYRRDRPCLQAEGTPRWLR
ncbi:MAG TPA: DUF559 domain-containing protein [Kofleriaceae bacterium]|nr:DUF559 domain-containing protein [Kofleriaceae bacterium]